jgi:hypothetical protein
MTEFKNLDPNEVKRGDVIEVSAYKSFNPCYRRIFVSYVKKAVKPYICVFDGDEEEFKRGEIFDIVSWPYARKLRPDLKIDDPVIVWDLQSLQSRRHFAGWTDDRKILTYIRGKTKWTSEGETMSWDHWRLPTKEELEGKKKEAKDAYPARIIRWVL